MYLQAINGVLPCVYVPKIGLKDSRKALHIVRLLFFFNPFFFFHLPPHAPLLGSGWAGTFGHIDPELGIAVVFGTQVVPSQDGDIYKLRGEFERMLYSNLQ